MKESTTDGTAPRGSGVVPIDGAVPGPASPIRKSSKLDNVCYDIRGPVLEEAHRLEEEGHRVMKLNIGNPAPFGFDAPEEMLVDVIHNLPASLGYCDAKGIYPARKAVMQYAQKLGIGGVGVDDVFIGNGVSELVMMALQGLLENGDEVLLPAPDFPLWSAAVNLCGGSPVHYLCDEDADWAPDLEDLAAKLTPCTRALVVINPNNPTGAVYSRSVLNRLAAFARRHGLVVFADEIYDKIIYDDAEYIPFATLADDLPVVTFSGLSKSYRAAGFRTGWMIVSGAKERAEDYIEGLNILASLRLCSNVPTQHAVQAALGGYQSIGDLVRPGGRLREQRDLAWQRLTDIEGVTCVKPRGALYLFAKLDTDRFNIVDDERFVLDLLRRERILVVQGSAFNWPRPDHFRIVFLPHPEDLRDAIDRLRRFLQQYRQQ
ncbi:MAG: pyridoxal phosphate-dependent aminotransferase [Gammaproteobacteria bacterium]|nr:pyridoxal phosphate-dependent aminotransferase [Gammaproteobacteria bacterium]MDE0367174.1 pyridoxal phosphate-dependent aminotransferase [Gammaproteobacteria bacterium]